jgi:hypothetical protein
MGCAGNSELTQTALQNLQLALFIKIACNTKDLS